MWMMRKLVVDRRVEGLGRMGVHLDADAQVVVGEPQPEFRRSRRRRARSRPRGPRASGWTASVIRSGLDHATDPKGLALPAARAAPPEVGEGVVEDDGAAGGRRRSLAAGLHLARAQQQLVARLHPGLLEGLAVLEFVGALVEGETCGGSGAGRRPRGPCRAAILTNSSRRTSKGFGHPVVDDLDGGTAGRGR